MLYSTDLWSVWHNVVHTSHTWLVSFVAHHRTHSELLIVSLASWLSTLMTMLSSLSKSVFILLLRPLTLHLFKCRNLLLQSGRLFHLALQLLQFLLKLLSKQLFFLNHTLLFNLQCGYLLGLCRGLLKSSLQGLPHNLVFILFLLKDQVLNLLVL